MLTTVVYKGDELIGEVNVCLLNQKVDLMQSKIRITHFSQPSERCPPLAVLHAISSYGLCFKIESKRQSEGSPIYTLHSSCLLENKTAVMTLGDEEEVHLVAMHSRRNTSRIQCFWGFIVGSGLYNSCLSMLNLRCLGIVFDLDETLVVANTMRSFEDKIEALQRKINTDLDPQRISGMVAEVKRYQDDKIILKQYVENDQVIGNGKIFKIQSEVVPNFSDNRSIMVRPLIRLHDKNIILTRINPVIPDTSVLVRLRPAWEDLRSYLTARGRKRFEVFVCTMAERDYALEMWRLLDPDSNLINSKELQSRIVCVKSGLKKSLFNVFQDGICHPKMALVIDDRLKVWDEKDQPRVHVVPAFAPYYAPQAEANNTVPVLCVARNVACNARGGFFKEFDDNLLQRINGIYYEDDISDISSPDVSTYLVSEDGGSTNGIKDPSCLESSTDADIEKRLKDSTSSFTTISSTMTNLDPRLASSLQFPIISSSNSITFPPPQSSISSLINNSHAPLSTLYNKPVESVIQASPAREEGEVPESELDPDTRRRLLILQHGQDTRDQSLTEPPFPVRPPLPVSVPQASSHGSWFMAEEEMNQRPLNPSASSIGYPLDSDPMLIPKQRPLHSPFYRGLTNSICTGRSLQDNKKLPKEIVHRDDRLRFNNSVFNSQYLSAEEEILSGRASLNRSCGDEESGEGLPNVDTPARVLQRIAMKCSTKVEFRSTLVASNELQFIIEVWFADEKIGEGSGRTRREAQHRAAEGSLSNLAYKFLSNGNHDSSLTNGDLNRSAIIKGNDISSDINYFGIPLQSKEEAVVFSTVSESSKLRDPRVDSSKKSMGSVSTLEEFCMAEGLEVSFQDQSPVGSNSIKKDEVYVQVEINGQVVAKGMGLTWDEAMTHAADKALGSLKSRVSQFSHKRPGSPRPLHGISKKRLKPEIPRPLQRTPSSARFSRNSSPAPERPKIP